ncbi:MAG: hypothetical protein PF572_03820 [Patescibacteria group bacterium]|jgi:cell division protein FtsX|nr:hypothetical protein [Patescibacteria group bacterium]
MSKIQDFFNKIQVSKKKQADIRKMYKDALDTSQQYGEIVEKIKTLRDKKKEIENVIQMDFSSEFDKLENLKIDIESDNMMMSDLALNQLTKGEMIEISDEYENKYEPIFNVKFKKL